jgi:hypothetical protein
MKFVVRIAFLVVKEVYYITTKSVITRTEILTNSILQNTQRIWQLISFELLIVNLNTCTQLH